MIHWLLQSIGISDALGSQLEKATLSLARPWWLWIGLILLPLAGWYITRRHAQSLPYVAPWHRALLTCCRLGVLLMLFLVLAGPYLRLEERLEQKPVLAVVIDESDSMALPAGPFDDAELRRMGISSGLIAQASKDSSAAAKPAELTPDIRKRLNGMQRRDLLRRVLSGRPHLLANWRDHLELKLYRVAQETRLDPTGDWAALGSDIGNQAQETNLGGALEQIIQDALMPGSPPLAGILLFSDGRTTIGPDPVQVVQRQATANPQGAAPVWVVPVGGTQPPADLAIFDVLAPAQVATGDRITVLATLNSQGLDGREAAIQLLEGAKVLDQASLKLQTGQTQQVALSFRADASGLRRLTVRAAAQPEEVVQTNNLWSLSVKVDPGKLRVLYLEGYPRWDFRFLDHGLRRDNGLEASLVMESQLPAPTAKGEPLPRLARLPLDAGNWARYHVVILGDISPDLLPEREQDQLAKAVREEGVGLLVQAGPEHMPHAFAAGPLAKLLPMPFDEVAASGRGGLEAPVFAPFRMKVTAQGAFHPALVLYDSATKNRQVWSQMPTFYWAVAAGEALPGATVLAQQESAGQTRPLIVEHMAGRGRVLVVGTDSTFLWRRNIGGHLFDRFWGQAIRHLAAGRERPTDRSWIDLSPARIEPGDSTSLQLYAVDADGRPRLERQISVQQTRGDQSKTVMLEQAEQPGLYRSNVRLTELGDYRFTYTDSLNQTLTAAVSVSGSGRETQRPWVDRDALGRIADSSGGGLVELDRLSDLTDRIQKPPRTIVRIHEAEVWDNWIVLALLVGLYCTDVGLRRMLGLT